MEVVSGKGVTGMVGGHRVAVGNLAMVAQAVSVKLDSQQQQSLEALQATWGLQAGSVCYVIINGSVAGEPWEGC
jgi:cation transport ATPase